MKNTLQIKLLAFLFLLASAVFAQNPAGYIQPKGSAVSLKPPAEFVESSNFTGFANPRLAASIMIVSLDAKFENLSKVFTKENLAKKGINLLNQKKVSVDGRNDILYVATQTLHNVEFSKWILLFGEDDKTIQITASLPKRYEKQLGTVIENSLLSLKWDSKKTIEPTEGLNFSIKETDKLKISGGFSKFLSLTLNGEKVVKDVNNPLFIAGQSFSTVLIPNRKLYAEARAKKYDYLSDVEIIETKSVNIDGADGFATVFHGTDNKTGTKMFNYQVMLFQANIYFLLLGTVSLKNKDLYFDDFKKISESFKLGINK
jgi:hypothetical protein